MGEKRRNIIGTNTPFVLDGTVADPTFGLILSAARRICELDKLVKEGKWMPGDDTPFFGVDVHHSTLGIIGMGRMPNGPGLALIWTFFIIIEKEKPKRKKNWV